MFRPLAIDHLVLRVVSLPRMLHFYCDVLGCTVEKRQDDIGLVQLRAGSALIDLVPVDGPLGRAGGAAPGAEARNLDHFCLRVAPFEPEAIRAHLARAGLAPGPVGQRYGAQGEGPSVYVSDPEGNVVELKGERDGPRIRPEQPADRDAIARVIGAAFEGHAHSAGTEAAIVRALRAAGALAVSLVAEQAGEVVGHVALSRVTVDGADVGWYGLGPVAVRPALQGQGIGAELIRAGLAQLRPLAARGCVVLGEPAYYARFGFVAAPALRFPGAPAEYFMAWAMQQPVPAGTVAYHAAFDVPA